MSVLVVAPGETANLDDLGTLADLSAIVVGCNLTICLDHATRSGLNPKGAPIWHHGSSGHAAIALAWQLITEHRLERKISLLGFTMTPDHFHGDHEGLCEMKAIPPTARWRSAHEYIARQAPSLDLEIRDYTRNATGIYPVGDWSCLP